MKSLEAKIKNFEREILELKTAQKLSPSVKAYYYNFTVDMTSGYSTITAGDVICYRINYAQGENEILTEWSGATVWATTPANNTQFIYIFAQHTLEAGIYSLSTRKITSIEKINLS